MTTVNTIILLTNVAVTMVNLIVLGLSLKLYTEWFKARDIRKGE